MIQCPTFHIKVRQVYAIAAIILRYRSSCPLAGSWNVMKVARLLPLGTLWIAGSPKRVLSLCTRILETGVFVWRSTNCSRLFCPLRKTERSNAFSSACENAWDRVPTMIPKQLDYYHPTGMASVFTQQARIVHVQCWQDMHSESEEATAECDPEGEDPACSGSIKPLRGVTLVHMLLSYDFW
ncbi:hypothetical protein D9613_008846 [Agrocybe pediades]|uniref:Uncharacterized protein n=1 Tax=Agrocybe pediades TaxID=84607 RepID=A0A8H4VQ85_9AGAR|nr:hypothetical protein D9613_008846 [Agrocybe pediades]